MSDDYLIDNARSAHLCAAGLPGYVAATAIEADGAEHLVLVQAGSVGDKAVRYNPACPEVEHEQLGPLPLDVVRRITISRRTLRCGRRTKQGAPCQTPVARAGDACGRHRAGANA